MLVGGCAGGAEICPSPCTRAGWPGPVPGMAPSPPRCPCALPAQPIATESGWGNAAQTNPQAAHVETPEAVHVAARSRDLLGLEFRDGSCRVKADVSPAAPRSTRRPQLLAQAGLHKLTSDVESCVPKKTLCV